MDGINNELLGIPSTTAKAFLELANQQVKIKREELLSYGEERILSSHFVGFYSKDEMKAFLKLNADFHNDADSIEFDWTSLEIPSELTDDIYIYWLEDEERYGIFAC